MNKTAPIFPFAARVLRTINSRTDDITEDVFFAIERNSDFRREYDTLIEDLGKGTVNSTLAQGVQYHTSRRPGKSVRAKRTTLIKSYKKLTVA